MQHLDRIDSVRGTLRFLADRSHTRGDARVPNTPAWCVSDVATHVGWALTFWRHMMESAPDDETSRDRALAETPPFPPGLTVDDYLARAEPILAYMAGDEHAACYLSMAGGPGTLGLWSRHALSEIGVHRMDVEAALGEAYGMSLDEAVDGAGYVAGFVLPAFRRMVGEDPGALTVELTDDAGLVVATLRVRSEADRVAVVRGPAVQALLALWGRPHQDVAVESGDADVWTAWRDLPTRAFQFAPKD